MNVEVVVGQGIASGDDRVVVISDQNTIKIEMSAVMVI